MTELIRCKSCKHYSSDEELNKADFRTCVECTKKLIISEVQGE